MSLKVVFNIRKIGERYLAYFEWIFTVLIDLFVEESGSDFEVGDVEVNLSCMAMRCMFHKVSLS